MKTCLAAMLIALALPALSGCGNKGPLVLPAEPVLTEVPGTPVPATDATPAEDVPVETTPADATLPATDATTPPVEPATPPSDPADDGANGSN